MESAPDIAVVLCTISDEEKAAALGRELVERRLAACVNIVPRLRSIYRWKGELCDDPEALMILKTRRAMVPALREAIAARHPYEVCEIVALDVTDCHAPYLAWLIDSTAEE